MGKMILCLMAVLLTGCTTSVVTGHKKLLGVKIPFTGSPEVADPKHMAMVEQLAPFVWVALLLIVAGAVLWKITNGSTGLGVTLHFLGWGLVVFAVVMPQIAGWLGLISILGVLCLAGYLIWKLFDK